MSLTQATHILNLFPITGELKVDILPPKETTPKTRVFVYWKWEEEKKKCTHTQKVCIFIHYGEETEYNLR